MIEANVTFLHTWKNISNREIIINHILKHGSNAMKIRNKMVRFPFLMTFIEKKTFEI